MRELLRKHLLFTHFDTDQMDRISACSVFVALKEGEHLFRQGQDAHHFYLLIKGSIKLYRLSADGDEKVIELIREGQTFAEAVMFMQGKVYPVNAQALTGSRLLRIDMKIFYKLLENSAPTCLKILAAMSKRLHGTIQDIEQLTLQNANMRVIHFLLRELPPNATSPYTLHWQTPKSVLASRLSVRPETFSRILQQLSQKNLIRVEGKNIQIPDIDALRHYTGAIHELPL